MTLRHSGDARIRIAACRANLDPPCLPAVGHQGAGLSAQTSLDILSLSTLVLAASTILQALPRGYVGARLLCSSTFTAAYFGPSLSAVKSAGLSLVLGMTVFGAS